MMDDMADQLIRRVCVPARVWNLQHLRVEAGKPAWYNCVHITSGYAEKTDGHILVRIYFDSVERAELDIPENGLLLELLSGTPRKGGDPFLRMVPVERNYLVDPAHAAVARVEAWNGSGPFPDTEQVLQTVRAENRLAYTFNMRKMNSAVRAAGISGRGYQAVHVGFPISEAGKVNPFNPMRVERQELQLYELGEGVNPVPEAEIVVMPMRFDVHPNRKGGNG